MRRIFALLGFTSLLTCIICLNFSLNISLIISIISFCVSILFFVFRKVIKVPHFYIAFVCISITALICFANIYFYQAPAEQLDNVDVKVEATLIENPTIGDGYCEYTFETVTVNGIDNKRKFKTITAESINIEPYDNISADVHFTFLDSNKETSWSNKVFLRGNIRKYELSPTKEKPIRSYLLKFRSTIQEKLYDITDNTTAMMMNAIVLNNKTNLSASIKSDFKHLGLSHTMAVSGMHVSLIAFAVLSLLTMLYVPLRKRCFISILVVIIYLVCVGFVFSAVRAGIMIIILLLGKMFFKTADSMNSLGFACAFILFTNPYAALNTGFLLSVCSMLGMIILFAPIMRFVSKIIKGTSSLSRVSRAILTPILQTLCAQIFTLPIYYATIGNVSLVSPIANLLCLPFVTLTVWLSILSIVFLPVPYINVFFGFLCKFPVKVLLKITGFISSNVTPSLNVSQKYIGLWIAGGLIIFALGFLLVAFLRLDKRKMLTISTICCVLSFGIIGSFSLIFNSGVCTITTIDSGNGVCVAIKCDNKLYICGIPNSSAFALENYVTQQDADIEAVIIPKFTKDFFEATSYLPNKLNAKKVFADETDDSFAEFKNALPMNSIDKLSNDMIKFDYKANTLKIFVENTSIIIVSDSSNITALGKDFLKCDIAIILSNLPKNIGKINANIGILCADKSNSLKKLDVIFGCADTIYPIANSGSIQIETRGQKDLTANRLGSSYGF